MTERPERGTREHLRWMKSWLTDCAADLGKPVHQLHRDAFRAWVQAQEGDGDRPQRNDIESYGGSQGTGGWAQLIKYVADENRAFPEPHRGELAMAREVARANSHRRALEREIGDDERFAERLASSLAAAVERTPPIVSNIRKPALRSPGSVTSEVVAIMSDLHFGACVDRREVPRGAYSWQIAARRLALFCNRIVQYKTVGNRSESLRLVWLGDAFDGKIHNDDVGVDLLVNQIDGTRQILVSAVDFLRHHFAEIRVECAAGNHGRWPWKGSGRPAAQKYDGADTVVARGVEHIFRNCDDVSFSIPRTPYNKWESCGHAFMATHGDSLLSIKNPERGVMPKAIAVRLYDLESSELGHKIDALLLGHHHFAMCAPIPGRDPEATLVVNGSTLGRTAYSQTEGYSSTPPCQTLWTTTEESAVTDWNKVNLRAADDNDALDAIIPPPIPIGEPLRAA
jgi:hypothetical protein